MSFGWSIGDVIAGIDILIKVFRALDDAKGGKAAYSELSRELSSLQNALNGIEKYQLQSSLDQAVGNCQKCIDTFVDRINKFKGIDKDHGNSRWSLDTFRRNARAVEWAMCKKGEVDDFRRAVLFHTGAILSLQISVLSIESKDHAERQSQGQSRVDLQLKTQVSILSQVESQLQNVIDTQKGLLQGFEFTTDEYKQISSQIRSEMSDMAYAQGQSQYLLEDIRRDMRSIDSRVRHAFDLDADDVGQLSNTKFQDLADKCMKALFVTDPAVDRREIENRRDRLVENSCDWVLELFDKFLDDETVSRLWLHGDPGKGKTMIAMSFVDYLSKIVRYRDNQLVAYFFCDNTSDKRNTLSNVCKTLLYQVLEQMLSHRDEYTSKFLRNFDSKGVEMFGSIEAIWTVLEEILLWADLDRIHFIVDALDECDEQSLNNFLTLVAGNLNPSQDTGHSHQKVKWVLISRNEPAIKDFLATAVYTMTIDLAAYESDIRRSIRDFIEVKVEELSVLKRYDSELKAFVTKTLQRKAEGTFLWVSLACRELRNPRIRSINTKMVLERLPSGLTRLYDRIYEQVLSNEFPEMVDYAKEILRSVTLALSPLSLGELAVLADLPVDSCDFEQVEEYVEQCGSFLTLREPVVIDSWETDSKGSLEFEWGPEPSLTSQSGDSPPSDVKTVHFVHQSAKDYLLSRPPQNSLFSSPDCTAEHEILAIRCLGYIDRFTPVKMLVAENSDGEKRMYEIPNQRHPDGWDKGPKVNERTSSEHWSQGPEKKKTVWREPVYSARDYGQRLCEYSGWKHTYPLQFWMDHGNLASERMLSNYHFKSDLFRPQTLLSRTWVTEFGYDIFRWPNRGLVGKVGAITVYHVAVALGAIWVISKIGELASPQDETSDLNYKCKDVPLMWAVEAGTTASVRYLLEHGANPNTRHPEYGSYNTAIYLAAWLNPLMLDILLEFNADLEAKDEAGDTVFLTAMKKQELDIARVLLEKGAHINASDNNGFSALHHVAMRNNHETMDFLLEAGVDPNLSDKKGRTALHLLARFGSKVTANLLVSFGAEIDKTDDLCYTPLFYAVVYGKKDVASCLVNHGAEVRQYEEAQRSLKLHGADPWSDLPILPRPTARKGCLRPPRIEFPEDPPPSRPGVAPLRDMDREVVARIPPAARWTKISMKIVSPEALDTGKERFDVVDEESVIVLRALTRDEVRAYAEITRRMRNPDENEDDVDTVTKGNISERVKYGTVDDEQLD